MNQMNTRELIQQTAIRLFYEQGYKQTTIAQIAKQCNISNGVVSYYYKTKSLLGNEILGIFSIKRKNLVARKYYEKYKTYDLAYATGVELRLLFDLFEKDAPTLRFCYELANYGNYDKMSVQLKYYRQLYEKYNLPYDEKNDELSLVAHCVSGATDSMLFSYFGGEIDCDPAFACNYYIQTFFILQKLPMQRIDEIIQKSFDIYHDLNFEFKPYFEVV